MEFVRILGEYKGCVPILVAMLNSDEHFYTDIHFKTRLSNSAYYPAMKYLIENKMVEEIVYHGKRVFKLTDKGRAVSEKLKEIDGIMRG